MHAVQTSCCHLADAARPAARTNGRGRTFCRDITGNSEAYWAAHGDKGPLAGVAGTAKICDVSRAMGLALARAGALGAVARLAQHWVACVRGAAARTRGLHRGELHAGHAAGRRPAPARGARALGAAQALSGCRQELGSLTLRGRRGRTARCCSTTRRRSGPAASSTRMLWPALQPPSRASRLRPRSASPRTRCRRPAWRTCACRRPRCAPRAAGSGGAPLPDTGVRAPAAELPSALERCCFTSVACPRRCRDLSSATEAGLRLQQCSGCNTARYCSEACQKAAWRAGHKAACRGACKRAPD